MRKGGGKSKGASFEREVCRDLSRFVDPDGDDTLFWRSSMSGGRGTLHRRKGVKNTTQLGDITCVHESGHWLTEYFYVECKFYRDLDLASALLFGKGKLAKFWRETCERAEEYGKAPLLIARQNNTRTLALFSKGGLDKMAAFGHDVQTPRILVSNSLGEAQAHVCFYEDVFVRRKRKRRTR